MHGSIHMSKLYLYVCYGYFTAFYTRVHKFLFEHFYFAFSSAYSIEPHNSDATHQDGTHIIPYGVGDLEGEEPHHQ